MFLMLRIIVFAIFTHPGTGFIVSANLFSKEVMIWRFHCIDIMHTMDMPSFMWMGAYSCKNISQTKNGAIKTLIVRNEEAKIISLILATICVDLSAILIIVLIIKKGFEISPISVIQMYSAPP